MKTIFLIAGVLLSFKLWAAPPYPSSAAPSEDNNYFIHTNKPYKLLFDKQYFSSIDYINQNIKSHVQNMSVFQKRKLKNALIIHLLSDKNQTSNALASLFPFNQITMFSSGFAGIDWLANPFWTDSVFVHELAHIYQTTPSAVSWMKSLKSPFGFLLFFFHAYPNIFLPPFLLEGDAVLKESLLGLGGRLYSGYTRALVLSQISFYRNNPNKLALIMVNDRPHAPLSKTGKYMHGGYFWAFLAETFSHQTVNRFFTASPKFNTILPIFPFSAFPSEFKKSFHQIVRDYVRYYSNIAYLQRSSSRSVLFESAICPPFNEKGGRVFFLTSNLISNPTVRVFNKKLKKWFRKKINLPTGKLFKIKNNYYSRASHNISPHVKQYSLFSEGWHAHPFFNSKYVEDIKNGNVLYIDAKNTLDGFKLYFNGRFYSFVHSNALFGPDDSIYYFKQNGNLRTLYKNQQPLFSYLGYYGNLIDIDSQGTVYFTGASPYGSSIFQYKNQQIQRSVSSDTVVRAKKISEDEFLVCEITPNHYVYKIIPKELISQTPSLYRYNFENSLSGPQPLPLTQTQDNKKSLLVQKR